MSDLSRRRFIQGAAALFAGAIPFVDAVPVFGKTVTTPEQVPNPSGGINRSVYEQMIGQSFQAVGPNGRAAVVLAAVSDLKPATTANDPNSYLLEFHADPSAKLPQDVYTFSNTQFGAVSFLAVPVDRVTTVKNVEVVINRTVGA
jgi:hypothetical protein